MATTSRSKPAVSEPTQAVNPVSNVSGSISMNTRRNVSCEGMPFGSSRNVCSQASLLRPYPTFTVCGPNLLECIHNSMAGQLCSANLMRTDAVQPVAKNEFIGEECDFGDFALKPQFAERRCILYCHRASFVAITPLPEFW